MFLFLKYFFWVLELVTQTWEDVSKILFNTIFEIMKEVCKTQQRLEGKFFLIRVTIKMQKRPHIFNRDSEYALLALRYSSHRKNRKNFYFYWKRPELEILAQVL